MSDEYLERAVGKIGEETVSLESVEREFIFNNPVLGSVDSFTAYAGLLGMVSSLEATEDIHKAITALLALAKEYYCELDDKQDKELKEKIATNIDSLEEKYKESLYWLRPLKRTLDTQTEVLTRNGSMLLTEWAKKVEAAEKGIFAKEGPFKILQEIMRSLVNNRIEPALVRKRKDFETWKKDLFPEDLAIVYKNIISVRFIKKSDLEELEKDKEGKFITLTIPNEMIVKGPLVRSATMATKPEKEYVRFGVSPFYNIQRDLTSMILQENALDSFIHFGRALKNLETQIIAFVDEQGTLLVIDLKLKEDGKAPIISPSSFIKITQLLHELNLLLTNRDQWTLVELLELYEFKRDVLIALEDFVSSFLPIFMRVLMRNPYLKKKAGLPSFEGVGEAV